MVHKKTGTGNSSLKRLAPAKRFLFVFPFVDYVLLFVPEAEEYVQNGKNRCSVVYLTSTAEYDKDYQLIAHGSRSVVPCAVGYYGGGG